MEKYQDGEWFVFKERTRKSFGRFKPDASRGLFTGLAALATSHRWEKNVCHIAAPGSVGQLIFEPGERGWNIVTCRVRLAGFWGTLLRDKILSDIEHTTIDVCDATSSDNRNVFIVHGHGHDAREELAALLKELGLNPIILEHEDDLGMTVIEKFETYAADCSFAFVLMTPDDLMARRRGGQRGRSRRCSGVPART